MDNNLKDRSTIYSVAKRAGVSLATVSRVINGKDNVTEKTKQRVQEAIKELGYRPSALARGLATNKSTNIGIVLPGINYVYICNMLAGMTDIAKIYGYQTTLFVARRSKEDTQSVIEKLISSHVDGAVIFDDELSEDEIKYIQNYSIPLIVIGHKMKNESLGSITLDYCTPIMNFLKKYFEKEPDGIVHYLDITMAGNLMDDVRNSILKFTSEEKKALSLIRSEDSYQRLYSDMRNYFESPSNRKGLFVCPRDSLACAVINAATDLGVKISDDIQVISVVGTKYSYIVRPQVSSLDIDLFEVGSIAVRMLTKLLRNELSDEEKVFNFSSRFIARGSTKND